MGRGAAVRAIALAVLALGLAAPHAGAQTEALYDPIEPFNRRIFSFNEAVDRWVLEPVAKVWDSLFPHSFHLSLRGAYENARMPVVFVNDLLQWRLRDAAEDLARLVVNSTLGVGGLLDPATRLGLEDNDEDFGQTLAIWGVPGGPFLIVPVLGASNPRDLIGSLVERAPSIVLLTLPVSLVMGTVDVVNRRALLLETIREEREAAFDLYAAVRNAYVQQRRSQIAESQIDETGASDDLYYFEDDE